jgi:hypothetical protein
MPQEDKTFLKSDEDFSTNKTLMLRGTRAITKDGIEFYVIGENTL